MTTGWILYIKPTNLVILAHASMGQQFFGTLLLCFFFFSCSLVKSGFCSKITFLKNPPTVQESIFFLINIIILALFRIFEVLTIICIIKKKTNKLVYDDPAIQLIEWTKPWDKKQKEAQSIHPSSSLSPSMIWQYCILVVFVDVFSFHFSANAAAFNTSRSTNLKRSNHCSAQRLITSGVGGEQAHRFRANQSRAGSASKRDTFSSTHIWTYGIHQNCNIGDGQPIMQSLLGRCHWMPPFVPP